jgi:hypothetical protein
METSAEKSNERSLLILEGLRHRGVRACPEWDKLVQVSAIGRLTAGAEVLMLGRFVAGPCTVNATPSGSNGVVDLAAPQPGSHGKHGGF